MQMIAITIHWSLCFERLDELKYAIQDGKADALVVETFGRRIEKLLQECNLLQLLTGSVGIILFELLVGLPPFNAETPQTVNRKSSSRLGATGASEAMFIPSTEAHDTSYFMSRYTEDGQAHGSSDLDDLTDTCSSGSLSNMQDEDGDECGSLTDFSAPALANLSQLASINYDLVVKNAKESAEAPKPSEP
ncbi:hypothetical protein F3Y22_tig00111427pilonHSYRG00439 [Hibiscus syriacus]|uniref:Uncharacterized protein n=1 Tax=Hibiscus syriacus TaxID=106335 RepID=A0A6A2YIL8_HIBSY|nr:hypothetical protein F3Y22_tig00111427pilonHSYRG00439 [Hibiscus syriacus]